jgi:hypothetical protein
VAAKFQPSSYQFWRVVKTLAALLTEPLTVAVHRIKKPCIYNGFVNLNTDGHRWARMKHIWWGERPHQPKTDFAIRAYPCSSASIRGLIYPDETH